MEHLKKIELAMRKANQNDTAIRAFRCSYLRFRDGETGMIPEETLSDVGELMGYESLPDVQDVALLGQTAVIKLNGGLGTSMGLEKAKSLMPVKDGESFLDFICRQFGYLRQKSGVGSKLVLMNSFATSADTREALKRHGFLDDSNFIELIQSQVPKIDVQTNSPIVWDPDPALAWCPPGHGDLYASLWSSGALRTLQDAGIRYLFVSNSDNLGASLDARLLSYFAGSGLEFMMEVAERTVMDRKGGHLGRRAGDGRLILRESAQCPASDASAFQDIETHRFFNTNNLWLRVDSLAKLLEEQEGTLKLPLIANSKTVDPRDANSPRVVQLETAMGAAIELFENSGAVLVPRSRFAPVKTTAELLLLRSDLYEVAEDFTLRTATERQGKLPPVELDAEFFKKIDDFDERIGQTVPSLMKCDSLSVQGDVFFEKGTSLTGDVKISADERAELKSGEYGPGEVVLG